MFEESHSRIVISGLAGDSGKTVISCGLLAACRNRGLKVAAFKKGPDFIDSAWLSLASNRTARNLDTYLMGFQTAKKSFLKNAHKADISIIEGNRGLFDGLNKSGTHSTAELAKLLDAPVIIVQNISKVTRTAAASILGCINLDPELKIAGVILNSVAGERHGRIASGAIEDSTGIPVLGIIPKLSGEFVLPSRHLGLITPEQYDDRSAIIKNMQRVVEDNVDISEILEISSKYPIDYENKKKKLFENAGEASDVKIGYFKDRSFSFYYPENLEILERRGAKLISISPIENAYLGDIDALYIGGGFPETKLVSLSLNFELKNNLKLKVEAGLPVYAECGGLMYLAESIEWNEKVHQLSGVLPIKVKMYDKPKGHGYCEATVDNDNPFYETGTVLKGHEFHYSAICDYNLEIETSLFMSRGTGCFNKRDGIIYKNVFAGYLHIHALATPEWANGMITCAKRFQDFKKTSLMVER